MERIQVDISGLSTSQQSGGAYALILKEVNGSRRLPIIIGAFEAQSIALEIEGIKPPRPLTHDLIKNILESFGADLREITISELRDGTFFATLNVNSQEIDARPSDAIALAVRFRVPIYVSEKVMDEASIIPESDDQATSTKTTESHLTKLEALKAQLNEAVEREDYERAAKLRDAIKKIEQ